MIMMGCYLRSSKLSISSHALNNGSISGAFNTHPHRTESIHHRLNAVALLDPELFSPSNSGSATSTSCCYHQCWKLIDGQGHLIFWHMNTFKWCIFNRQIGDRLSPDFSGQRVLGRGFDRDVFLRAGIADAAAFAAVSSGDNSNIISARVARETFGVARVVARREHDDGRVPVVAQALGDLVSVHPGQHQVEDHQVR